MPTLHKLVSTALLIGLLAFAAAAPARTAAPDRDAAKKRTASTKSLAAKGTTVRNAPTRVAYTARPRQTLVAKGPARRSSVTLRVARYIEPSRPSFGQTFGLHDTADALDLKSGVALVLDQDTDEVLFSKNSEAVLPIASLTKLMTALVVAEAGLPLETPITITDEDIDTEKGSRSRLAVGTQLRREEMLHLALMSSENRAANALGRTYPGGLAVFVAAMNRKAALLGMKDTRYVEPTGLSSRNQSSAHDLAILVRAAHEHRIIRELSTSHDYEVEVGRRAVQFRNTNGLVRSPEWDIGLQKTGYISEAGRCLVMQAKLAGRHLIMVFLDSAGKYSRIGDAERVRRWVTEAATPTVPLLVGHKPTL